MAEISAKRRVWGWWWFEWASQPYHTLLVTFVYGPFFAVVAAAAFMATGLDEKTADAEAQALWSWTLTITGLIIGFGGPIMGAMADSSGQRRPWVMAYSVLVVVGSAALWYTNPDGSNAWIMLAAFGLGFIGAEFALIFVNAQLPGLVEESEIGKVSGSGFAFGYIGGLVSLAIMLLFFVEQPNGKTLLCFDGLEPFLFFKPIICMEPAFGLLDPETNEGTRFVGPFSAVWYAVFMIPYFLWVRDRPTGKSISFRAALRIMIDAVKSVARKRSLGSYLLSSMFYRDALNGLYSFGGVYATLVLDWSITLVGVFGIVALISSALFAWVGGKIDSAIGPKPVIIWSNVVLIGVVVIILFMSREQFFGMPLPEGSNLPDIVFFSCGVLIGGMGGTLQSASRSLMVRHADPKAPTESFGLYGLSGRATSFLAPFLIGLVTTVTGSARLGVSPLIGLFLLGLVLLVWVKPGGEKG